MEFTVVSRKSHYNVKGTPIQLFKTCWHGLLLVIKQFVTCEGRYGLVFLFHIWLLMIFLGLFTQESSENVQVLHKTKP
jgi:hypothetical protein